MYQINFYDLPIYDDQLQELFPVLDAKLNLEVNDAGGLNFSIPSVHPNFADLKKLKMGIAVVKNGKTIFKGRIVRDTQDFNNSKSFECEGKLAALNDTIYRPYDFAGSPADYFASLIENHNSMVEDEKKFKVGEITVTDPNDYITRSSIDHKTTWELLKNLVSGLGGYLHIRYEADGDYIDWLDDFKYTNTQKIEFAENLLDITQEVTAEETYTACIPLGAKIEITNEDGTTETTDERLTVASVNDGKDYIFNAEKVEEYGWKFAPASEVTWDDVTRPENLLTKATDYLNNNAVMLAATLELSAVDLAYTDADIDSFEFCQYVQVISVPHNLEKSYLLSKISIDMLQPKNTKITLGDSVLTLYDSLLGQQQNINNIVQKVEKIESEIGNAGGGGDGEDGIGIESYTRYYLLQGLDLDAPVKPTTYPPSIEWNSTEPAFDEENIGNLYTVDCTVFSDGTWTYTDVSLSTSYEAAKAAQNTAQIAIQSSSDILNDPDRVTITHLEQYTKQSAFEDYQKTVENTFVTGTNFQFLSTQVTNINDEVTTLSQNITFDEGVIKIGHSDSAIKAVFDNDSLEFQYNKLPVAEFTNEKLGVRNVSVENQVSYSNRWATRQGAYVEGVGYNLNDVWIGG